MITSNLQIGLADFAEPTLLILGDAASFNWLAHLIENRQALDFNTTAAVKLVHLQFVLEPTELAGSLTRTGEKFVWRMSSAESKDAGAKLRALAASQDAAHTYLDPANNTAGVELVASMGEYEDRVFRS